MGRGCDGCAPPREITEVRFINHRHWPEQWIRTAAPGDLLLLEGKIGECGGVLRLKRNGAFLVLTSGQVWRGHHGTWPFKDDNIKGFRLRGNKLEFVLG